MRIAELYGSVQGEGRLTGTPSVFVRASGCNLRCEFCDTPYASWRPEGPDLSIEEIVGRIEQHDQQHVVITGGEPMLFAEMIPLCERLKRLGYHITVETAGTLFLTLECDLMSISPKLANSTPTKISDRWIARHEQSRFAPQVMRRLMSDYDFQLKFVCGSLQDVQEIIEYLAHFPELRAPEISRHRVMLMPMGTDPHGLETVEQWLEPLCEQHHFTFCPRRHIEWFGAGRGT